MSDFTICHCEKLISDHTPEELKACGEESTRRMIAKQKKSNRDIRNKAIGFTILLSVLAVASYYGYQSYKEVQDPDYQFEGLKSQIERMKLSCGEGFEVDGTGYGYTGEIWRESSYLQGDNILMGVGFSSTITDEQRELIAELFMNKLKTLPCYDEYLIWADKQVELTDEK